MHAVLKLFLLEEMMKKPAVYWMVGVCTILLLCVAAQARRIKWNPQNKPPVSLAQALPLAQAALGKDASSLWCVNAELAQTYSQGDWIMTFSNKKGECTYVSVGSDQKVRVVKPGSIVAY